MFFKRSDARIYLNMFKFPCIYCCWWQEPSGWHLWEGVLHTSGQDLSLPRWKSSTHVYMLRYLLIPYLNCCELSRQWRSKHAPYFHPFLEHACAEPLCPDKSVHSWAQCIKSCSSPAAIIFWATSVVWPRVFHVYENTGLSSMSQDTAEYCRLGRPSLIFTIVSCSRVSHMNCHFQWSGGPLDDAVQALTLSALALAGLSDVYEHRMQTNKVCNWLRLQLFLSLTRWQILCWIYHCLCLNWSIWSTFTQKKSLHKKT